MEGSPICGLVGFVTKNNWHSKKKEEIITSMLYADSLRGLDSTGVAVISDKGNLIYKRALSGYDFITTRGYKKAISQDPLVVLGHNRLATHGAVNDENAHPFLSTSGRIYLTHNGVVSGYKPGEYDVDTKWLVQILDKEEPDDLKQVNGSFALAWYDTEAKKANFCRNDVRELYYAMCPKMDTMFYCSEAKMLEWILFRNAVEHDGITLFEPSTLYSIDPKTMTLEVRKLDFSKPQTQNKYSTQSRWQGNVASITTPTETKGVLATTSVLKELDAEGGIIECYLDDIDSKSRAALFKLNTVPEKFKDTDFIIRYFFQPDEEPYLYGLIGLTCDLSVDRAMMSSTRSKCIISINDIEDVYDEDVFTEEELNSASTKAIVTAILKEVPRLPYNPICYLPGPKGDFINEEKFDELTKHGCAYCSDNIKVEDAAHIAWTHDSQPICYECAGDLVRKEGGCNVY